MKLFGLILVLMAGFLLLGCVPAEKRCAVDDDCVQATCCHATDAVNMENAPDCEGQLCTAECVPETLDCGQGTMRCVEGACAVVLK